MLGEEPSDDCNGTIFTAEQKVCINFTNENTKFSLSLYCSGDLKLVIKIYVFLHNFV